MPFGKGNESFALKVRRDWVARDNVPPHCTLDAFVDECSAACSQERCWKIIRARCGFDGSVQTLATIAREHDLSRERIRQIQVEGDMDLIQTGGIISALNETLVWLLKQHEGVASVSQMEIAFTEYFPPGKVPVRAVFELLSRLFSDVYIHTFRGWPIRGTMQTSPNTIMTFDESTEDVDLVLATARHLWKSHLGPLYSDKWVDEIVSALCQSGKPMEAAFIRSCLRADGRFDPDLFECVDVTSTEKQGLERTLQRLGKPAHYSEIVRELNRSGILGRMIPMRSAYNCLCAHHDIFVCVGKGIYGLSAWGLEGQRITRDRSVLIVDLIEEFLKNQKRPASTKEIINYVMSKKKCSRLSIGSILADKTRFRRVAIGFYVLANSSGRVER